MVNPDSPIEHNTTGTRPSFAPGGATAEHPCGASSPAPTGAPARWTRDSSVRNSEVQADAEDRPADRLRRGELVGPDFLLELEVDQTVAGGQSDMVERLPVD